MPGSDSEFEMADEYDLPSLPHFTRGPLIPPKPNQTRIWLCVDDDLLEWYRAKMHAQHGGDYAELMHEALRLYREYAENIQSWKKGA